MSDENVGFCTISQSWSTHVLSIFAIGLFQISYQHNTGEYCILRTFLQLMLGILPLHIPIDSANSRSLTTLGLSTIQVDVVLSLAWTQMGC